MHVLHTHEPLSSQKAHQRCLLVTEGNVESCPEYMNLTHENLHKRKTHSVGVETTPTTSCYDIVSSSYGSLQLGMCISPSCLLVPSSLSHSESISFACL